MIRQVRRLEEVDYNGRTRCVENQSGKTESSSPTGIDTPALHRPALPAPLQGSQLMVIDLARRQRSVGSQTCSRTAIAIQQPIPLSRPFQTDGPDLHTDSTVTKAGSSQ